jgi:predicted ATPase
MQFAHYLLAHALVASGQAEPALELVDRILAEIVASGGRWYEAEIHRLRGDILRGRGQSFPEIESCYEAAIAVARRQGARAWELKAEEALGALQKAGAKGADSGHPPTDRSANAISMPQANAAPRST